MGSVDIMQPTDWIHLIEVGFVPIVLLFLRKLTTTNASHSTALFDKIDQFRVENTDGINNLADKIERTLERHGVRLDNHNGRISNLEGRSDTPNQHRRYTDTEDD